MAHVELPGWLILSNRLRSGFGIAYLEGRKDAPAGVTNRKFDSLTGTRPDPADAGRSSYFKLVRAVHCAERRGDRGGYERLLFYPGRREAVSWHLVWETLILRELIGKQKTRTWRRRSRS